MFGADDCAPMSLLKEPVQIKADGFSFEIDRSDEGMGDINQFHWDEEQISDNYRIPDADDDDVPFASLIENMTNVTADGGVKKQLQTAGNGNIVPLDSFVTVHYNAYLNELSDDPFDSTWLRGEPQRFFLGEDADVTRGLVEAVRTMKKDEKSLFVIAPEYFYGRAGSPPRIPPNATVLFEIKLIEFVEMSPEAATYYRLPASERSLLPYKTVASVASLEQNDAKAKFQLRRFWECMKHYTRAIRAIEQCKIEDDDDEMNQKKVLITLYRNMAACNLKVEKYKETTSFCDLVIHIDSKDVKAHFLKAKALRLSGKLNEALETIKTARSLDPVNNDICSELAEIEKLKNREKNEEKQMYAKMCTGLKGFLPSEDNYKNKFSNELIQNVENFVIGVISGKEMETIMNAAPLTDDERNCYIEIARNKGLTVVKEGYGANQVLKFMKKK